MLLFDQKEPSIEELLKSLNDVSPRLTFIKKINRMYQYSDEPKFYHYIAKLTKKEEKFGGHRRSRDTAAGGSITSDEEAYLKCLGEAIERYASSVYIPSQFKKYSYSELNSNSALNPQDASVFSEKQLKNDDFYMFRFNEKTKFQWADGYTLSEKAQRKALIPAQLIYYNYKLAPEEKYIRLPISTGTAGGGTIFAAILRGTFEILERDAFMISFLNKLPGSKVDLNLIKDSDVSNIIDIGKRYRLDIHVIDITTDIKIPCFVTIIVDRTGIGSAVTLGLKCHFDPIKAICESFEEALHSRCWMRRVYEDNYSKYFNTKANEIDTTEERGMYWYTSDKIKYLDFWLKQKPKPLKNYTDELGTNKDIFIIKLLKELEKNNMALYYVDLTPKFLNTCLYKIIKVIIPTLYPFYMNERYKYLGHKRLFKVPIKLGYMEKINYKFNERPHPFL